MVRISLKTENLQKCKKTPLKYENTDKKKNE